jgi:hypothetical protein
VKGFAHEGQGVSKENLYQVQDHQEKGRSQDYL